MKPLYWILILVAIATIAFFLLRKKKTGTNLFGKTVIKMSPEELEQYASDMCEGTYENEGVNAFNVCRQNFIASNS